MEEDKQRHTFKPNSRFSRVISLYCFDEELRLLVFSAIQQIEVAVRARMIRLLVVEQVYRAMTIIKSEPYHHE